MLSQPAARGQHIRVRRASRVGATQGAERRNLPPSIAAPNLPPGKQTVQHPEVGVVPRSRPRRDLLRLLGELPPGSARRMRVPSPRARITAWLTGTETMGRMYAPTLRGERSA